MKTKTKRFAASAAVLLLTAVLVFGCVQPLDFILGNDEGMGARVAVNGGNRNARTILPLPGAALPTIAGYYLAFMNETETNQVEQGAFTGSTATSGDVPLAAGTYVLHVYAVANASELSEADFSTLTSVLAFGKSASFTVTSGMVSVPVTLAWLDPATADGTGIFRHELLFPAPTPAALAVSRAQMTITDRSGGTTPGNSSDSDNNWYFVSHPSAGTVQANSGNITLDSGYYNVLFTLTNQYGNTYYRDVLHVYRGMTSTLQHSFTAAILHPAPDVPGGTPGITPPSTPPEDRFDFSSGGTYSATGTGGSGTLAAWGSEITLSISGNGEGTITITGASNVDWYTQMSDTAIATGANQLVITAGDPGWEKGPYGVTVDITYATGSPYSTYWFIVNIVD